MQPILITGCTGIGKSSLAIELAKLEDSKIINADSMQVYSSWNILSSRPSNHDISKVPHRLYGYINHDTDYNVGKWIIDVEKELFSDNLRPIIVGGTGLYFKTLLKGLSQLPKISKNTRSISNYLINKNPDLIKKILFKYDFNTFNNIDIKNLRRLQRAYEVFTETGNGLSFWKNKDLKPLLSFSNCKAFVLNGDVNFINKRINERFDKMLDLGVIDEVNNVFSIFKDDRSPASKALGAKQIYSFLKKRNSLKDAVEEAKMKTRQYAKKQRTWFRNQFEQWENIQVNKETDIKLLAKKIQINYESTSNFT